jgi:hypothetical protein
MSLEPMFTTTILPLESKATPFGCLSGASPIREVILLDSVLERYGPETKAIRERIKEGIAARIEQLWPTGGLNPNLAAIERPAGMDEVHDMIQQLAPQDEVHRILRSHAATTCIELAHSRWLIIEQAQTMLPMAFLGMLVFWLTVLFASLGLLAPRNASTWCSLFVCAVSMAGAIYLILEMNRPLEGAVQISPAPLQKALSVIGKAG